MLALAAYASIASLFVFTASDWRERAEETSTLLAVQQRAALECGLTRDFERNGLNTRVSGWRWLNSSCGVEVISNGWVRGQKELAA